MQQNIVVWKRPHQQILKGFSFVKNQQTADSDIDFIVEFEKEKKTYKSFIKLAFFLEELLGRKVDLLTNKSLSPYLGPQILKETENVPLGY